MPLCRNLSVGQVLFKLLFWVHRHFEAATGWVPWVVAVETEFQMLHVRCTRLQVEGRPTRPDPPSETEGRFAIATERHIHRPLQRRVTHRHAGIVAHDPPRRAPLGDFSPLPRHHVKPRPTGGRVTHGADAPCDDTMYVAAARPRARAEGASFRRLWSRLSPTPFH